MMLDELVSTGEVVVCCGTGGVGKTTTAAALAVAAARNGRRVVVVTIDPARRLADAMGIEAEGNACTLVAGDWSGELSVTMLDTKTTFDNLIVKNATSAVQAERILANRYYRNLSTTLSGTREFMAMEKLYELDADDRFDLVIVDTPPSRNALHFLEAPDLLGRFLDGRLFRFAMPSSGLRRKVTAPLMMFLRRIARVISPEVVDDTLAFIEAFAGMEDGFRDRAKAVTKLLHSPTSGFVLVTAPSHAAMDESQFVAEQLSDAGLALEAIVINRMQPSFTDVAIDDIAAAASAAPKALAAQLRVLHDAQLLVAAEEDVIAPLLAAWPNPAVVRVPQLDADVHSLEGIAVVCDALTL